MTTYPVNIQTVFSFRANSYAILGAGRTLEAEFSLQQTVQYLTVLTAVGVIQPVIRTHDVRRASKDRVLEWPKVQLMYCLVIEIRRYRLDGISFRIRSRVTIDFLFIGDVVLLLISFVVNTLS